MKRENTCRGCQHIYNPQSNSQRYCSIRCRDTIYRGKNKQHRNEYQRDYLAKRREGQYGDGELIPCLICGKKYRQVGSHIVQVHHLTARQYREQFELEVKKGLLPLDYRESKGKATKENGTVANLKKGEQYWFTKGCEVPKYKRSPITMDRIRRLYKFNKTKEVNNSE